MKFKEDVIDVLYVRNSFQSNYRPKPINLPTQLTDLKTASNVTVYSEVGYRSNPINFDTQPTDQIHASNVGAGYVGSRPSENINIATFRPDVQTVNTVELPSRDTNVQHLSRNLVL